MGYLGNMDGKKNPLLIIVVQSLYWTGIYGNKWNHVYIHQLYQKTKQKTPSIIEHCNERNDYVAAKQKNNKRLCDMKFRLELYLLISGC